MSLKGKNALITGSTSGIGLSMARALAKEGANITLNGLGDQAAIGGLDFLRVGVRVTRGIDWAAV